MKQFYFYESYAKPICKLTNKEIGQVSKAICGYMFEDREPSEKTLPKAKALFYLLQEQLTEENLTASFYRLWTTRTQGY